ncbi:MAG: 30S ribosomal protein S10 [Candidatus Shikimatogenerans sp. Ttur]|uniref:Small ribosomal subunit protein uS10 n=1 Tax=Candidatus Shikimatogenerans sp. Ttur TaxID=3158569 RepID=A0AAU7ZXY4_9FLAO
MNNKKIIIKLKSYNYVLLNLFINKIYKLVEINKVKLIGPIYLPTKKKIITVLKSHHVHKKSCEQFILLIYRRALIIINVNNKILNDLNKIKLFYGIDVNIKNYEFNRI